MNLPGHRIVGWLGKAALKTHALQTLRDCRASPKRAKRLECVRFISAFRRARDGPRFMVPMYGRKAGGAQAIVRVLTVPLLGGVSGGFMVAMNGINGVVVSQTPASSTPGFWSRSLPGPRRN